MNKHIREFFYLHSDGGRQGGYHTVIALHEAPDADFERLAERLPKSCRGWLELAQLLNSDRTELVRDHWLGKFQQYPKLETFLLHFFQQVDEIGVWVTQKRFDDPFDCHLVYSMKGGDSYFRGSPGASEEQLLRLQSNFSEWVIPSDFASFLSIHNGFAKTTDCSGILGVDELIERYRRFQLFLSESEELPKAYGRSINPKTLIPFYQSFGMPYYQCFWAEWHPETEMGNVYYSGQTNSVYFPEGKCGKAEELAFDTFADWLIFYLEGI